MNAFTTTAAVLAAFFLASAADAGTEACVRDGIDRLEAELRPIAKLAGAEADLDKLVANSHETIPAFVEALEISPSIVRTLIEGNFSEGDFVSQRLKNVWLDCI